MQLRKIKLPCCEFRLVYLALVTRLVPGSGPAPRCPGPFLSAFVGELLRTGAGSRSLSTSHEEEFCDGPDGNNIDGDVDSFADFDGVVAVGVWFWSW